MRDLSQRSRSSTTSLEDLLEAFSDTPGAILVRTEDGWEALEPDEDDKWLHVTDEGAEWATLPSVAPKGIVNGFRLTALSGDPCPAADKTSAATIYLTPWSSGEIWTLDSGTPTQHFSAEVSLSLAQVASGFNYDVFAYWRGDLLALELGAAWTSDTARAVAIARDPATGTWVKGGDPSRLYVGTVRASAAGVTEDSNAKRFIWNAKNRVVRYQVQQETTASWTKNTATYSAMNGGSAKWKNEFVIGLDEDGVIARCDVSGNASTGGNIFPGIGLDTTSASSGGSPYVIGSTIVGVSALYEGRPGIGYHYLNGLNGQDTTNVSTWYGSNEGSGQGQMLVWSMG